MLSEKKAEYIMVGVRCSVGINCLTFEEDPEPFGKARDESIIQLCREANVEVIQVVSHTLYKLDK